MRPTSMRPLLLSLSIAAALGVVASGCQRSPSPEPATPAPAAQPATTAEKVSDEHSYAEPDKVQTTDLALDLAIDFAQKQIRGTATYSLEWLDQNANQLLLDTRAISIQKAEGLGADGKWTELTHTLAGADPILGSKLTIDTPNRPA